MAELSWDDSGQRFFETGIDHGVFYPEVGDGVVWNGLVSVNETISGGEATSLYYDGTKYLDFMASEDFKATLEAFTYPDEFALCDGSYQLAPGLFATKQPRKTFGLSYRTRVGNDLDEDLGYKLHLVYNAVAAPSARPGVTRSKTTDPANFQWEISAVPVPASTYKPTAHFVIDSRKVAALDLAALEDLLYGTVSVDAALPTQAAVIALLS